MGVFDLYIVQNRQGWRNFAWGHQDIKICIPFLLSGGAGGNLAQVWENWQIETVNLKAM